MQNYMNNGIYKKEGGGVQMSYYSKILYFSYLLWIEINNKKLIAKCVRTEIFFY